jgi:hypothetical protein
VIKGRAGAGGDPHVHVREGVRSANEKRKNTNQLVLVVASRLGRPQQASHSRLQARGVPCAPIREGKSAGMRRKRKRKRYQSESVAGGGGRGRVTSEYCSE